MDVSLPIRFSNQISNNSSVTFPQRLWLHARQGPAKHSARTSPLLFLQIRHIQVHLALCQRLRITNAIAAGISNTSMPSLRAFATVLRTHLASAKGGFGY